MASPTKRDPRVSLAQPYQNSERQTRRPQHPFNVRTKPFQIQPVCLAPVLPGETLKSILLQSQVWSDPLNVQLKNTGWWCEYNVFYVKHRDMPGYEVGTDGLGRDLVDMFVSNESIASHQDADGNAVTYCPPGGVDFVLNAVRRVVDEYFRDEGESYSIAEIDGIPLCQIYGRGRSDAFDKLTLASAYADHRQELDADGDGTIYVGDEMNRAFQEWAVAHDAGIIDMTYDDWMKTYGGRAVETDIDRVDYHRPEDLAYMREFTYPTNTVEPTTGVPAVAVGWRVASRLDKRLFFREPGWLIGFNTVRPKVYLGKQQGAIAGAMQTRASWLPPVLANQEDATHILFDDAAGPLKGVMDAGNVDYWIDLRDLLKNGDQFVNYATPASGNTGVPFMALPSATGQRRYASSSEIMALFSDTTNGRFRQDGVLSLSIQGRIVQPNKSLVLGSGGMV